MERSTSFSDVVLFAGLSPCPTGDLFQPRTDIQPTGWGDDVLGPEPTPAPAVGPGAGGISLELINVSSDLGSDFDTTGLMKSLATATTMGAANGMDSIKEEPEDGSDKKSGKDDLSASSVDVKKPPTTDFIPSVKHLQVHIVRTNLRVQYVIETSLPLLPLCVCLFR